MLILNDLFALNCTEMVQNAVCFVRIANERLRPYEQSPESKNANQEIPG